MSALAVAVVGLGALAYISMRDDDDDLQQKAEKTRPDGSLDTRFNSGAIYTDVKDCREILDQPGMIESIEIGTDLSGVPCRWLKMTNGVLIRTYDMQTQFHQ